MDDQTLILAAALLLSLIAVAFAAYERGQHNGYRAGCAHHQCATELAMVAQAKGRHPSSPARSSVPPPPGVAVERAGAYPDVLAP